MLAKDIRSKFLDFFASKNHRRVASGSLIPKDDPTLLFTNAGMVPFKRLFTGEEKRDYQRATTSQKCVRAGGKHNDLENVGYTARHHTFFEMLGNFSFGDYFKEQAIEFAWDLLINTFKLPQERLYATVYQDDDQAFALWEKISGLPASRIKRLGDEDNFWSMGDTGPCGPCSEILIDQGEHVGCKRPDCQPGCDCDRFLEIWNLVFMQFERSADGKMTPLPKPSIDTGMGLERLAAVSQGVLSNFETDLFTPIIEKVVSFSGQPYKYGVELFPGDDFFQTNVSTRVIADHSRSITFLISDGVRPENLGRGYVLRRILRRALRHARKLGLDKPFLAEMSSKVIEVMSEAYPELKTNEAYIKQIITAEEARFSETLGQGLSILNEEIDNLKAKGLKQIDGDLAFKLYDTYGFPLDLVADVAREHNMSVDENRFNLAMEEQKTMSRASWKGASANQESVLTLVNKLTSEGHKTTFDGYNQLEIKAEAPLMMIRDGAISMEAQKGDEIILIFAKTPFYAASGGQSADKGIIEFPHGKVKIENVEKAPGTEIIMHEGQVIEGRIQSKENATLKVDPEIRLAIAANHSATHILHRSLRAVLGDQARQAGSLVEGERLRFDFTHNSALTIEELEKIEQLCQLAIMKNYSIDTEVMDMEKASQSGAMALFEERYGDQVRVVSMGDYSKELCGGTHIDRTGNIGCFVITAESSVSAGVRRLECLTGLPALKFIQRQRHLIKNLEATLKSPANEIPERITKLMEKNKELEKTLKSESGQQSVNIDEMLKKLRTENAINLLSAKVDLEDPKELRLLGDRLKDKLSENAIIALGSTTKENKAIILVMVSNDLTKRFKAGELVAKMALEVGGKGGGRPDMAQAGGPDGAKIDNALQLVNKLVFGE